MNKVADNRHAAAGMKKLYVRRPLADRITKLAARRYGSDPDAVDKVVNDALGWIEEYAAASAGWWALLFHILASIPFTRGSRLQAIAVSKMLNPYFKDIV